jgi:hypothetical protein
MQKLTAKNFHDLAPQSNLLMKFLGSGPKNTPIFDVHGRGLATALGPVQTPPLPAVAAGFWGEPAAQRQQPPAIGTRFPGIYSVAPRRRILRAARG